MFRLSTNLTLFLKFFIPVFWICFFTGFTIATWLTDEQIGFLAYTEFKIGLTLFTLAGILFFYLTVHRLKRVDANDEFLFVSNYFKTNRIPWESVEKLQLYPLLIFKLARVQFSEKTYFGKHIYFLASSQNFREFRKSYKTMIEEKINSL